MTKITRYDGPLPAFGRDYEDQERTTFGETLESDSLNDNINTNFTRGWGIVGPNEFPTLQDFNAVNFTLGRVLAYLHQMGIAEWNSTQDYYPDSIVSRNGAIYRSKTGTDASPNTGNDPETDDGTNWEIMRSPSNDTVSSVSDLRSSSFPASLKRLWLTGYSSKGDGGHGPLYRTTGTDNGYSVFVDADDNAWARFDQNTINANQGGGLADAVANIGSDVVTLVIDDTQTISADLTIPENVELKFFRNGIIEASAGTETLTINGGIAAGLWQVFGDSLSVGGSNLSPSLFITNFGAKEKEDSTDSIQKTIDAVYGQGGGNVIIPEGEFYYSETIFMVSNVTLSGEGWQSIISPLPGMNDTIGEGLFSTIISIREDEDAEDKDYIKTTKDITKYQGPHVNVTIKNLKIHGTKPSENIGERIAPNVRVLEAFQTTGWFIENNWIVYSEDGAIRPNSSAPSQDGDFDADLQKIIDEDYGEIYNIHIKNNRITEGYFGIETIQFPKYFWIEDNWIEDFWAHGLRIHGGRDGVVKGNILTIEGSAADGYASGDGLYIDRAYRIKFSENTLYSLRGVTDTDPSSNVKERAVRLMEYKDISICNNIMVRGHVAHHEDLTTRKGLQLYDNIYIDEGNQHSDTFTVSDVEYDYALIPVVTYRVRRADNLFVREVVPTNSDRTAFKRYTQDSGLPDYYDNPNGYGIAILHEDGYADCYRFEVYANDSNDLEFTFPIEFTDLTNVYSNISGFDTTNDTTRLEACMAQIVMVRDAEGQNWVQRCSANYRGDGTNNIQASLWARGKWKDYGDWDRHS